MIVYKFPLQTGESIIGMPTFIRQSIPMPEDAQILHLRVQHHIPTIWASCGTEPILPNKNREFITIGTGVELPEIPGAWEIKFIGTFEIDWFVGHVFELIPKYIIL